MKKLFLTIMAGLTLFLFVGCNKTNDIAAINSEPKDAVTINADRDLYTPYMSSARGFKLTSDFKSSKTHNKLEYHWITAGGEFISDSTHLGNELRNQGESVLWSSIENDKVVDIKNPFDVKLEVIDTESKKILASTKLTITPTNGFYEIKK